MAGPPQLELKLDGNLTAPNMHGPAPPLLLEDSERAPDEATLQCLQGAGPTLPPYARCRWMEVSSVAGLGFVWGVGTACIALAGVLFTRSFAFTLEEGDYNNNALLPSGTMKIGNSGEAYALMVTALITVCTESTGFIHDVCLRWNMFAEGRLAWVTNPRLLSTSRTSWSTRLLSNLLYLLTLTVAYTASSQIFVAAAFSNQPYASGAVPDSIETLVSGSALMSLGTCLVVQAALISWIYISCRRRVKTWSSNPLTIALACVTSDARLASAELSKYRSIDSAAVRTSSTSSSAKIHITSSNRPKKRQPNLTETRYFPTSLLTILFGVLPFVVIGFAASIFSSFRRILIAPSFSELGSDSAKLAEQFNVSSYTDSPAINPFPWQMQFANGNSDTRNVPAAPISEGSMLFISLLIVCAIQSLLTFVLHAVELFANSFRDEGIWQRATSKRGAAFYPNALLLALTSPANILLLVLKVLTHWLFNRCILPVMFLYHDPALTYIQPGTGGIVHVGGEEQTTHYWRSAMMEIKAFSVPAFLLAGAMFVVAVFALVLSLSGSRGSQPSTYGHIKTLAELVNNWGDGVRLFWGDIGEAEDGKRRRAGTAGLPDGVGPIRMEAEYL
jgi:hypothetical protein